MSTIADTATPTTTTANIAATSCLPDDFYIIYETYSSPYALFLDTRNNIIGKPLGYVNVSTDYYMPRDDLQTIYDAIIKYDIKSYSGNGLITEKGVIVTPSISYMVTFRLSDEIYTIIYNELVINKGLPYPSYPYLRAFHQVLNTCYLDNYYASSLYSP